MGAVSHIHVFFLPQSKCRCPPLCKHAFSATCLVAVVLLFSTTAM